MNVNLGQSINRLRAFESKIRSPVKRTLFLSLIALSLSACSRTQVEWSLIGIGVAGLLIGSSVLE